MIYLNIIKNFLNYLILNKYEEIKYFIINNGYINIKETIEFFNIKLNNNEIESLLNEINNKTIILSCEVFKNISNKLFGEFQIILMKMIYLKSVENYG